MLRNAQLGVMKQVGLMLVDIDCTQMTAKPTIHLKSPDCCNSFTDATAVESLSNDILGAVQQLQRISTNPEVMGGKPCIRGMRVTVGMIVEALAAGRTIADLLVDFPYLEEQDVREALAYAAGLAQGREFLLAS